MKKTIFNLIEKMSPNSNGTLIGGFGAIKGGASLSIITTINSTNDTCDGTNNGSSGCTNKIDCTKSTNTATPSCTNSGKCFIE